MTAPTPPAPSVAGPALLACPFCGGAATSEDDTDGRNTAAGRWAVDCDNEECRAAGVGVTVWGRSRGEAEARWNCRTPTNPTPPVEAAFQAAAVRADGFQLGARWANEGAALALEEHARCSFGEEIAFWERAAKVVRAIAATADLTPPVEAEAREVSASVERAMGRFHRMDKAVKGAEARGYARGIEDAAAMCERLLECSDGDNEPGPDACATAIRMLKEKPMARESAYIIQRRTPCPKCGDRSAMLAGLVGEGQRVTCFRCDELLVTIPARALAAAPQGVGDGGGLLGDAMKLLGRWDRLAGRTGTGLAYETGKLLDKYDALTTTEREAGR